MKILPALLLLASTGAVSASASAGLFERVEFRYSPIELSSEEGRESLFERLKATTQAACRGSRAQAYGTAARCRNDLEKQFVDAIGNPSLVAEYDAGKIKIARNGL